MYLLIDLEMTGLNPYIHGVCEYGWAILDEKLHIVSEWSIDICPPAHRQIDADALVYNGFTKARIDAGMSYTDFCIFFAIQMNTYFPDTKPIWIGQYVTADIVFLESIFHYADRADLFEKMWNDIIDTKALANYANMCARLAGTPVPYTSTSLSKPGGLAEVLGISGYTAHSASGDIYATREVLLRMIGKV